MKKPCIIGIKIATQVLKDGDEVEVDANKGVVKIFNKTTTEQENWSVVVSYKTELLSEALIHKGYRESTPRLLPDIPKFRNRMIIDNDIYIDLNETDKIQKYFITDTIGKASRVYGVIEEQSKKLITTSQEVSKDLSNLSNLDLVKRLGLFFKEYQDTLGMIGVPTIIDLAVESKLRDVLKAQGINDIDDKLATLAIPYKTLESSQERIDLLELTQTIKENKSKLDSEETEKLIKQHYNNYGWLHSTLFLGDLYDELQIKKEVNEIINKAKELIQDKTQENDKNKTQAQVIIDNIKSSDGRELAGFFQKSVYYRTARLEWMNKACFIARPLLQEVSQRLRVGFNDLIYFLPSEITGSLKVDMVSSGIIKTIKERKTGYAYVSDNTHEYKMIISKELDEFKKIHTNESQTSKKEIKGIAAFKGNAKGNVVIVRERSELNKVEEGDILVTRLTTPDFLVAMKRAAATVTDLGGITSHAAVTSREMNKPCIVGTKIATQVLKNGDKVEVDAENGIVRIVNKHK